MTRSWLGGVVSTILFLLRDTGGQNPPGFGPPGVNTERGAPPAAAPSGNGGGGALQACMDRVQTNPTVRQRYSQTVLQDMCSGQVEWRQPVTQDGRATDGGRAQLTRGQRTWLQSVTGCRDLSCICNQQGSSSSACANVMLSKRSISNGTRAFDRPLPRHKRQNLRVDNTLPNRIGRSLRREIRTLSDEERNRYFRAVNRLKFDRIDGMSGYDILARWHTPEMSPEAHFTAAFLPYHRELLNTFELMLRMIDPSVSLPYWDPTMDAPLPNPADNVLWTSDFYGNGVGDVTSGPFSNWITLSGSRLRRNTGAQGTLLSDQDVNTILSKPRFRNLVFCIDPFLETAHGGNHMWVGGDMLGLGTAANDPIFYSMHAFFDLMWEQWRSNHRNEYVPDSEACNPAGTFSARMTPFSITNGQGLSNRYTQIFYSYANRPQCPNCGSRYLFCDNRRNKCMSKVRPGGACNGFEGLDICYNSRCVNGRCSGSGSGRDNSNNNNVAVNRGGCRNNHACCVYWAGAGECSRNPTWMRFSCRSACGFCSGGGGGCGDSSPRCSSWAAEGQCQSNPRWMRPSCPLSCGTCNMNAGAFQCDSSANRGGTVRMMATVVARRDW